MIRSLINSSKNLYFDGVQTQIKLYRLSQDQEWIKIETVSIDIAQYIDKSIVSSASNGFSSRTWAKSSRAQSIASRGSWDKSIDEGKSSLKKGSFRIEIQMKNKTKLTLSVNLVSLDHPTEQSIETGSLDTRSEASSQDTPSRLKLNESQRTAVSEDLSNFMLKQELSSLAVKLRTLKQKNKALIVNLQGIKEKKKSESTFALRSKQEQEIKALKQQMIDKELQIKQINSEVKALEASEAKALQVMKSNARTLQDLKEKLFRMKNKKNEMFVQMPNDLLQLLLKAKDENDIFKQYNF